MKAVWKAGLPDILAEFKFISPYAPKKRGQGYSVCNVCWWIFSSDAGPPCGIFGSVISPVSTWNSPQVPTYHACWLIKVGSCLPIIMELGDTVFSTVPEAPWSSIGACTQGKGICKMSTAVFNECTLELSFLASKLHHHCLLLHGAPCFHSSITPQHLITSRSTVGPLSSSVSAGVEALPTFPEIWFFLSPTPSHPCDPPAPPL